MVEDPIDKLRELMKDNEFCTLTTINAERRMRSRPLPLPQTQFDGDLWFFTGRTEVVDDIQRDSHVYVTFCDGRSEFVSIGGHACFVEDPAKKRELWKDLYKTWFPGGLADPNLLLMKIEIDR
jgi:general stress protein 26